MAAKTVTDIYKLAKEAKRIKDESNIKIVGAVVPSTQHSPRIDELQSIVSDQNDAIDATASTDSANDVAKKLVFRVKRWVRPGESAGSDPGVVRVVRSNPLK